MTFLFGEGAFSKEKKVLDSLATEPKVALEGAPPQPTGTWPGGVALGIPPVPPTLGVEGVTPSCQLIGASWWEQDSFQSTLQELLKALAQGPQGSRAQGLSGWRGGGAGGRPGWASGPLRLGGCKRVSQRSRTHGSGARLLRSKLRLGHLPGGVPGDRRSPPLFQQPHRTLSSSLSCPQRQCDACSPASCPWQAPAVDK